MTEKIMQKPHGLMATTNNIMYNNSNRMCENNLSSLTKQQLIKILLKQSLEMEKLSRKKEKLSRINVRNNYEDNIILPPSEFRDDYKPIPKPRTKKPIPFPRRNVKKMVQDYEDNIILPPPEFKDDYKPTPFPRKSVKQMVQEYEDNIILPPPEFKDDYKPVPKPRTKKPLPKPRTKKPIPKPRTKKPIPKPRTKKPIPKPRTKKQVPIALPRTKIEEVANALKGYTKSFEIGINNNKDPLIQLQNTRKAVEYHIVKMLTSMKGLKFVETIKVTFKKISNDGTLEKTAYFNSKPQTIINNAEIPEALQLSKQQILNMIAQWISEGSGWTIESVDNHYLNVVQYQPMKAKAHHTSNYHKNSDIVKKD